MNKIHFSDRGVRVRVRVREGLFKQRSTKKYLTRNLKSSSEVCEGHVILDSYMPSRFSFESKTSSAFEWEHQSWRQRWDRLGVRVRVGGGMRYLRTEKLRSFHLRPFIVLTITKRAHYKAERENVQRECA